MSDIFTFAGIAVVAAGLIVLLKQYKPEYAFGAALAAGILLLFQSVILLKDIFDYLKEIVEYSGIEKEYFGILIRCLGICIVTKIASDLCKDCGQGAIESKIDFTGKTFLFISAMPFFEELIKIINVLINL